MRRVLSLAAVLGILSISLVVAPVSAAPLAIYSSAPSPMPGNLPSMPFEAQQNKEFGDRVAFEPSTPRLVNNIEVWMSTWGCETGGGLTCVTTPGSTFTHPITLNIYAVGPSGTVGSLLLTKTTSFAIPYRPSADSANCGDSRWFNGTACYNGMVTPIVFDLTADAFTAPDEVIVSLAYNTTHHGYAPIGEGAACYTDGNGCGYDSLNVALSNPTTDISDGSDPAPGDAYRYTTTAGYYCDGGTGGLSFRLDSPCWTTLTPTLTVNSSSVCTTVCYVDEVGGNDANGGTSAADAKKTIQAGINAVTAGGEVRVLPGTYNESPNITKSLTLVSTAGRNTTFIDLQTGPTYMGSLTIGGDDVTVDGFTVVGRDGNATDVATSNVLLNTSLDDIVIKNNKFEVGLRGPVTTFDDGFGIISTYATTPANFVDSLTVTNNLFVPLNSVGTRAYFINPGVDEFTFQGNTITGNFERIAWTGAANGLVAENTVTGSGSSAGFGATGYPVADDYGQTTFRANTVSGVAAGFTVDGANDVTVTRNVVTSSAKGVDVLNSDALGTFDPTTVHVNRNKLTVGSSNTGIAADPAFSSSVDGTCNWWGNFSGPGSIAAGSGSKVTTNVDYAPWLQSSNLDSECSANGKITIILDTHPNSPQLFSFTGTNGIAPFTLFDDGTVPNSTKSFDVPAGLYVFKVGSLPSWALIKLTCDTHETILKSHRLVQIQLHSDEDVTCTFTESYRVPDASIALTSGGPYVGDNIYSGAVLPSQTVGQVVAAGQTKSFWVRLQNDGLDKDTFRVASKLKGSLKFHVWFLAGNVDVTGKVNAGTYKVKLAPGATKMLEIRVTADATTTPAEWRQITLTMLSKSAPTARDTVLGYVTGGV